MQAGLTYLHDGALSFKVGDTAGVLSFSATKQGIDLQFAGQRALVNVLRKSEVAHIHTRKGATQIIAVDLLLHAGEAPAEVGTYAAPQFGGGYARSVG